MAEEMYMLLFIGTDAKMSIHLLTLMNDKFIVQKTKLSCS